MLFHITIQLRRPRVLRRRPFAAAITPHFEARSRLAASPFAGCSRRALASCGRARARAKHWRAAPGAVRAGSVCCIECCIAAACRRLGVDDGHRRVVRRNPCVVATLRSVGGRRAGRTRDPRERHARCAPARSGLRSRRKLRSAEAAAEFPVQRPGCAWFHADRQAMFCPHRFSQSARGQCRGQRCESTRNAS